MLKLAMSVVVLFYRMTYGRIGGRMLGNPVLLLTTIGRKSGMAHTVPLEYFEADGSLFIVTSNGGAPRHPAWYPNLVANPAVAIQRGREVQMAEATPASPERQAELWQRLIATAPMYARYQHNSAREIPIVLLQPVSQADATAARRAAGQR
jgi:deazaflavin-dependent oxidoreductase (nitroreductase family)